MEDDNKRDSAISDNGSDLDVLQTRPPNQDYKLIIMVMLVAGLVMAIGLLLGQMYTETQCNNFVYEFVEKYDKKDPIDNSYKYPLIIFDNLSEDGGIELDNG